MLAEDRVVLPDFAEKGSKSKQASQKMLKIMNAELTSRVYEQEPKTPKSVFKSNLKMPYHRSERDRLALTMSVEEVMRTSQYYEDESTKGKRRWKEIRHLFLVTRKPEHSFGSIENALWAFGHHGITCNHFVHAIMEEFNFNPEKDDMEAHLRWLYWSFDGGTSDNADWRDILSTLRICHFYRMVKERPQDLLLTIFDIYAVGGAHGRAATGHPNEVWYITDVTNILKRIFRTCCETEYEINGMNELVDRAILAEFPEEMVKDKARPDILAAELRVYNAGMKRRDFRAFVRKNTTNLTNKFREYCWKRIPVDLRLASLDELQVTALRESDHIMYKFKLGQAMIIYGRNVCRKMFKDWVAAARRLAVVRRHAIRKYKYKKIVLFNFWRKLASTERVKRNKRILADVMGQYSLKARTFYRLKVWNYQTNYIKRTVGSFNKHAKTEKLAFGHLREYIRLAWQRQLYHKWWNECVQQHNWELAESHEWENVLRPRFKAWAKWAGFEAQQKRMERLVTENKITFDRKMAQAEELAIELMKVEQAKIDKEKAEIAAAEEIEKQRAREEARKIRQAEKYEEKRILLGAQRDERRRRVKKQMAAYKKKFAAKWEIKHEEYLDKAQRKIATYIKDPFNALAIEMKFEKLKREFYAPPAKENAAREAILTNPKNIVFLYLDARLRKDGITMTSVIFKFDKDKRGYLTYAEFKQMVKLLGVKLNPSQMAQVIRAVDADGDGCVEQDELLESMKDIAHMGVVGSPWKMYVDPASDVIVYHNFETDEKIFEHHMKDEKLMQITHANLYGEEDEKAKVEWAEDKKKDWELFMNNLMCRRIQYMYRYWKARKKRADYQWKLKSRESNRKRGIAQGIASFCAKRFYAGNSRKKFERELFLTFEKIYKADTGHIFWFNHHLGTSHWERPHALWRYGDVPMPPDWIPIDVPTIGDEELVEITRGLCKCPGKFQGKHCKCNVMDNQMYSLHYWHVKAQRDIPRKPDGLPLCQTCHRFLAVKKCTDCDMNYCFKCLRATHHSPMDFKQRSFLTMEQRKDVNCLQQLKYSKEHNWVPVKYHTCQMCKTEKVLAGIHCHECGTDLCRPCSRRIHDRLPEHQLYDI